MKRISFFATKGDLLSLFLELEAKRQVKYYRAGRILDEPKFQMWLSGADLPKLGKAAGDQAGTCDSFIVLERSSAINVVEQEMVNGTKRCDLDQRTNPDSVILSVGGEWIDGSLISGGLSTASPSAISQRLMRSFQSAIKKKSFTRVQAFWVGPEALGALRSGKRLSYAIQSPPEYDLREV